MKPYTFMRVQLDYVNAVVEGQNDKTIDENLGVSRSDAENWSKGYAEFKEYLNMRLEARYQANGMNSDYVYNLLGRAVKGQVELSSAQVGAIKLIMQAKGIISSGGTSKPKASKIKTFDIEEEDE
jgi:hypothetical protein